MGHVSQGVVLYIVVRVVARSYENIQVCKVVQGETPTVDSDDSGID